MTYVPSLERWEGPGPTTWLYSSTGPLKFLEHPSHWQGNWEEPEAEGVGLGEGLGTGSLAEDWDRRVCPVGVAELERDVGKGMITGRVVAS